MILILNQFIQHSNKASTSHRLDIQKGRLVELQMELCQLTLSRYIALRTQDLCNKRLEPHTTLIKTTWIFPTNFNSTGIKLSQFFFFSLNKILFGIYCGSLVRNEEMCNTFSTILYFVLLEAFAVLLWGCSVVGTNAELPEDATLWMRRQKSQEMCVKRKHFNMQKCHWLEIIDCHIFLSKLIWYLLKKKIEYA